MASLFVVFAMRKLIFLFLLQITQKTTSELNNEKFPEDFIFGVASSAYQIEGAWNLSGKGLNVWDFWTHTKEGLILDATNGDVACDSYHKIQEDIALLKDLNVSLYRFSMSWSRILPTGQPNVINSEGVDYYKRLLKELKKNKISPMVTMYHFDLPKSIYDIGAWTNKYTVEYFTEYAKVLFKYFSEDVDYWLTIHDPINTCVQGKWISGIGDYLCMHNLLKAHASVYHLHKKMVGDRSKISINFKSHWYEPKSQSSWNKEASERALQFNIGWYAHPIYSKSGDYPPLMIKMVEERSLKEGFMESRLPKFTPDEIEYIKGTSDFWALTHYTTFIAADKEEEPIGNISRVQDANVKILPDGDATVGSSEWLRITPRGLRAILKWIKETYGDERPILVTGNGYSDNGEMEDDERIEYHQVYLSALLEAIHIDKVNVKAYTIWSLMDSFEWIDGYSHRFGLYHVDFKDSARPRKPKKSVGVYKNVILHRALNVTETPVGAK